MNQMTTTVIDASGHILGRLATNVAKRALDGETVHIVNAEKAILSGSSKKAIQERYEFKRTVGTMRKGPFFPREPHLIVKRTVRGMLKYQTPRGRDAYRRIQAHIGVPKELANESTQVVADAQRDPRVFMTVAELSSRLGRPVTVTQHPARTPRDRDARPAAAKAAPAATEAAPAAAAANEEEE